MPNTTAGLKTKGAVTLDALEIADDGDPKAGQAIGQREQGRAQVSGPKRACPAHQGRAM